MSLKIQDYHESMIDYMYMYALLVCVCVCVCVGSWLVTEGGGLWPVMIRSTTNTSVASHYLGCTHQPLMHPN